MSGEVWVRVEQRQAIVERVVVGVAWLELGSSAARVGEALSVLLATTGAEWIEA